MRLSSCFLTNRTAKPSKMTWDVCSKPERERPTKNGNRRVFQERHPGTVPREDAHDVAKHMARLPKTAEAAFGMLQGFGARPGKRPVAWANPGTVPICLWPRGMMC